MSRRVLRDNRLQTALRERDTLRDELRFESITMLVSDHDRHWRFQYGGRHIADYWPASALGRRADMQTPVPCASVAQAKRLAVGCKRALLKQIAEAMRQQV